MIKIYRMGIKKSDHLSMIGFDEGFADSYSRIMATL
jgi:hypothetical protein